MEEREAGRGGGGRGGVAHDRGTKKAGHQNIIYSTPCGPVCYNGLGNAFLVGRCYFLGNRVFVISFMFCFTNLSASLTVSLFLFVSYTLTRARTHTTTHTDTHAFTGYLSHLCIGLLTHVSCPNTCARRHTYRHTRHTRTYHTLKNRRIPAHAHTHTHARSQTYTRAHTRTYTRTRTLLPPFSYRGFNNN